MTDKELRKLNRMELIQLLLEQTEENERLQKELDEARKKLKDRRILLSNAGSLVEASMQITNLMEAAQQTADLYVENMKKDFQLRMEAEYIEFMRALREKDMEKCGEILNIKTNTPAEEENKEEEEPANTHTKEEHKETAEAVETVETEDVPEIKNESIAATLVEPPTPEP